MTDEGIAKNIYEGKISGKKGKETSVDFRKYSSKDIGGQEKKI